MKTKQAANKPTIQALRELVKSIDPETRVSKHGDWDGEYVVRMHYEADKTEKALLVAGYIACAPREIEGSRHNWWTILIVKAIPAIDLDSDGLEVR